MIRPALVVYLLIPTSNHNQISPSALSLWLYIFWFLHQTTTRYLQGFGGFCCISFDSYIKPQLLLPRHHYGAVVYLLIPTSNHNWIYAKSFIIALYIFWFLHQTTTSWFTVLRPHKLYIFWFLHQTTTDFAAMLYSTQLYIFWFLHQTTTYSFTN